MCHPQQPLFTFQMRATGLAIDIIFIAVVFGHISSIGMVSLGTLADFHVLLKRGLTICWCRRAFVLLQTTRRLSNATHTPSRVEIYLSLFGAAAHVAHPLFVIIDKDIAVTGDIHE
jgi:hypothetical protein